VDHSLLENFWINDHGLIKTISDLFIWDKKRHAVAFYNGLMSVFPYAERASDGSYIVTGYSDFVLKVVQNLGAVEKMEFCFFFYNQMIIAFFLVSLNDIFPQLDIATRNFFSGIIMKMFNTEMERIYFKMPNYYLSSVFSHFFSINPKIIDEICKKNTFSRCLSMYSCVSYQPGVYNDRDLKKVFESLDSLNSDEKNSFLVNYACFLKKERKLQSFESSFKKSIPNELYMLLFKKYSINEITIKDHIMMLKFLTSVLMIPYFIELIPSNKQNEFYHSINYYVKQNFEELMSNQSLFIKFFLQYFKLSINYTNDLLNQLFLKNSSLFVSLLYTIVINNIRLKLDKDILLNIKKEFFKDEIFDNGSPICDIDYTQQKIDLNSMSLNSLLETNPCLENSRFDYEVFNDCVVSFLKPTPDYKHNESLVKSLNNETFNEIHSKAMIVYAVFSEDECFFDTIISQTFRFSMKNYVIGAKLILNCFSKIPKNMVFSIFMSYFNLNESMNSSNCYRLLSITKSILINEMFSQEDFDISVLNTIVILGLCSPSMVTREIALNILQLMNSFLINNSIGVILHQKHKEISYRAYNAFVLTQDSFLDNNVLPLPFESVLKSEYFYLFSFYIASLAFQICADIPSIFLLTQNHIDNILTNHKNSKMPDEMYANLSIVLFNSSYSFSNNQKNQNKVLLNSIKIFESKKAPLSQYSSLICFYENYLSFSLIQKQFVRLELLLAELIQILFILKYQKNHDDKRRSIKSTMFLISDSFKGIFEKAHPNIEIAFEYTDSEFHFIKRYIEAYFLCNSFVSNPKFSDSQCYKIRSFINGRTSIQKSIIWIEILIQLIDTKYSDFAFESLRSFVVSAVLPQNIISRIINYAEILPDGLLVDLLIYQHSIDELFISFNSFPNRIKYNHVINALTSIIYPLDPKLGNEVNYRKCPEDGNVYKNTGSILAMGFIGIVSEDVQNRMKSFELINCIITGSLLYREDFNRAKMFLELQKSIHPNAFEDIFYQKTIGIQNYFLNVSPFFSFSLDQFFYTYIRASNNGFFDLSYFGISMDNSFKVFLPTEPTFCCMSHNSFCINVIKSFANNIVPIAKSDNSLVNSFVSIILRDFIFNPNDPNDYGKIFQDLFIEFSDKLWSDIEHIFSVSYCLHCSMKGKNKINPGITKCIVDNIESKQIPVEALSSLLAYMLVNSRITNNQISQLNGFPIRDLQSIQDQNLKDRLCFKLLSWGIASGDMFISSQAIKHARKLISTYDDSIFYKILFSIRNTIKIHNEVSIDHLDSIDYQYLKECFKLFQVSFARIRNDSIQNEIYSLSKYCEKVALYRKLAPLSTELKTYIDQLKTQNEKLYSHIDIEHVFLQIPVSSPAYPSDPFCILHYRDIPPILFDDPKYSQSKTLKYFKQMAKNLKVLPFIQWESDAENRKILGKNDKKENTLTIHQVVPNKSTTQNHISRSDFILSSSIICKQ